MRRLNRRLGNADIAGVRNIAAGRGIAMEHVVFYPSADGTPAFRRVASLQDAVSFVEHLRNSDGITEFSVHALAEVPLNFRAYYHVEVSADHAPAPITVDSAGVDPVAEAVAVESEPAEVAAAEPAPVAEVISPPSTPFADAPPVVPPPAAPVEGGDEDAVDGVPAEVPHGDSQEVVPVPTGRRSMGFFARS